MKKMYGDWVVEDIEIEDIEGTDYPDFCDAYISNATINGKEATEEQLDTLNDDSDFLYECVLDYIY